MKSKNAYQLFELAKEGQMHENTTVRTTLQALSICWDECIAEDLEQLLLYKVFPRKTGNPFHPEPYLEGELKIGASSTPAITRKQLTQGMLIVGRSGAGKTNFMYYLIMFAHRLC